MNEVEEKLIEIAHEAGKNGMDLDDLKETVDGASA
jgi:hypothetical protein